MFISDDIIQEPSAGLRLIRFRGDLITFKLLLRKKTEGQAWLRTNLGHASIIRREIIREVLYEESILGREWFDIPMDPVDVPPNYKNFKACYEVILPLCEVGHFEGKCYFIEEGDVSPIWPEGSNIAINVEPAYTCCSNIIYNAFVRLFGPNKAGKLRKDIIAEDLIRSLDKSGYTVIPPSGTFRDLIKELDFIIGELGCRVIHLLPINPTPTTFARMGRFGSPYAALSFTAVDPALAEFDPKSTPMEQFIELVDAIHEKNARILIDIAINHTGWAASLHETHPDWLSRDTDGRIEVPGAWGVTWADLTKLDYSHKELWTYMADVFLTWCRRGVDGFRCDAGYMIPVPAWKYIVAEVREQFPDTIFLLEGLGGSIASTRDILNKGNFNWAYSELFQNYDRNQIQYYIPGCIDISNSDGIMIHFAETHDNNRLAAKSQLHAKMRVTLSALFSHQGGYGFANGVEWYADKKIDVHEATPLNWGAETNMVDHIKQLNIILKAHPTFFDKTEIKLVQKGSGNSLALLRHHIPSGKKLLILINLDDKNEMPVNWDSKLEGFQGAKFIDLLEDKDILPVENQNFKTIMLKPAQVLCLTPDLDDMDLVLKTKEKDLFRHERIEHQQLRAKVLEVFQYYYGMKNMKGINADDLAVQLYNSPVKFCSDMNTYSKEPRVVTWKWPRDLKREVMIPPDHFLLINSDLPFRARLIDEDNVIAHEESIRALNGKFFTLCTPIIPPEKHTQYTLKLFIYGSKTCQHEEASILFLSRADNAVVQKKFKRSEILHRPIVLLGTNGRGGMMRTRALWEKLESTYDGMIAANLSPDFPEDRRITFRRIRGWIVYQGFSQEVSSVCLNSFSFDYDSSGIWSYHIPTSQGEHIHFTIKLEMIQNENKIRLLFYRQPSYNMKYKLDDKKTIRFILRPDIEDRNFHTVTKAYTGHEQSWSNSVFPHADGFTFTQPHENHELELKISEGTFVYAPEWTYMVHHSIEAERGLEPNSDLFSPGYFYVSMAGGDIVEMISSVNQKGNNSEPLFSAKDSLDSLQFVHSYSLPIPYGMKKALDYYIVKRGSFKSVIAGYPWFLDWGRDSLIFSRGVVADKRIDDALQILYQFGRFEKEGTLPNMISGSDAQNRDTSDAPLWFFVVCSDIYNQLNDFSFLDNIIDGRTLKQILIDIAQSIIKGTEKGVVADSETGLIFSPSHFTWMDTNHPAGTPREGYPIEIQALWFSALSFLSKIDLEFKYGNWKRIADKVKASILDLFVLPKGYLSDCIFAKAGWSPKNGEQDDALRPNQLLAITLGAVDDKDLCKSILAKCEELIIPGAIRSLADKRLKKPLPIYCYGSLVNDPNYPYQGVYAGNEDTRRKPAYHNGTAWTWMFPSYCEAWYMTYGKESKETALSLLSSAAWIINTGCVGHLPEILDGNYPHTPRGCDAQAWGASELLRVWLKITGE
ncbi:MAG: glycogen debranching enzyme N-terminal domain-containing protein [Desulfobacterales bacterium]|nr:glycogen debranching enzyme N-terminal domain-containing protein [Desulfobacterales bacterium]